MLRFKDIYKALRYMVLLQLEEFIRQHNTDLGVEKAAFSQAVERVQLNTHWLNQNKDSISAWLHKSEVLEEIKVKDIRLPDHLVPYSYEVILNPDIYGEHPGLFEFQGHVIIHMTATKAAKNVTLHANKLNITESSIRFGMLGGSGGPVYNGSISIICIVYVMQTAHRLMKLRMTRYRTMCFVSQVKVYLSLQYVV